MQLIEELFVHVHFYCMSNNSLSTLVVFGIQWIFESMLCEIIFIDWNDVRQWHLLVKNV